MLLKADVLEAIRRGEVDTVFRLWKRRTVKAGGTLQTAAGVLAIDAVEAMRIEDVTAEDAGRAGFASLDALLAAVTGQREGQLYRIRLRHAGPDPRIALREQGELSEDELAGIGAALGRLDGKAPWVDRALALIAGRPGEAAAGLAESMGMETSSFKTRVRKLKALGLTESLDIGYRLSPRGRAVLARRGGATASA